MIDQATGELLLVWTIRLSMICYLCRLFLAAKLGWTTRVPSTAECALWTLGCALYLVHVVCAFTFAHDWSHIAAFEHTAIETERITGVHRGEGLWVNYLFSIIWIADSIRLVAAHRRQRATERNTDLAVHVFFGFIVFNATVVFGPTLYRWAAIPVAATFAVLAWKRSQ